MAMTLKQVTAWVREHRAELDREFSVHKYDAIAQKYFRGSLNETLKVALEWRDRKVVDRG